MGTDDLLICGADDTPIGIAGVMGGATCEISGSTTDVLLEMAWFKPMSISRTSRRLGLRTEASARFEKGCDPEIIDLVQRQRFLELLQNPKLIEALNDPQLETAVKNFDFQKALDYALQK